MTTTQCMHCDHLTATIEAAHEKALVALTDATSPLDAVVWLSAHLAAVDRVVHPAIRRHVAGAEDALREQERAQHALHRALRALEQVAAGDALAARTDVAVVQAEVVSLMAAHAAGEHLLLAALARSLGADGTAVLAERYARAVAHGPTRPHPHTPHRGALGTVMYTIDRLRDHLLDVLDSRHVPIPKPRRARREPGRWGHYALGTMRPPE